MASDFRTRRIVSEPSIPANTALTAVVCRIWGRLACRPTKFSARDAVCWWRAGATPQRVRRVRLHYSQHRCDHCHCAGRRSAERISRMFREHTAAELPAAGVRALSLREELKLRGIESTGEERERRAREARERKSLEPALHPRVAGWPPAMHPTLEDSVWRRGMPAARSTRQHLGNGR